MSEFDKAFEKYVMSLRRFKTRDPMYIFALDENGDYDLQDVYELHHAWQASAQREGYKLVPVEDLKHIGALNNYIESSDKEYLKEITITTDRLIKTMIGASE